MLLLLYVTALYTPWVLNSSQHPDILLSLSLLIEGIVEHKVQRDMRENVHYNTNQGLPVRTIHLPSHISHRLKGSVSQATLTMHTDTQVMAAGCITDTDHIRCHPYS